MQGILQNRYETELIRIMNSETRTTVIFVRHAQSVYGSDDRNRPLSDAGLEDRKIVAEPSATGKSTPS